MVSCLTFFNRVHQCTNILFIRYGTPIKPAPRQVIRQGEHRIPYIELRPWKLQVIKLVGGETPMGPNAYVTISAFATIAVLYDTIMKDLSVDVSEGRQYRFWRCSYPVNGSHVSVETLKKDGATLLPLPSDAATKATKMEEEQIQRDVNIVLEVADNSNTFLVDSKDVSSDEPVAEPLFKPGTNFLSKFIDSKTKNEKDVGSNLKPAHSITSNGKSKFEKSSNATPGLLGLSNMCVNYFHLPLVTQTICIGEILAS